MAELAESGAAWDVCTWSAGIKRKPFSARTEGAASQAALQLRTEQGGRIHSHLGARRSRATHLGRNSNLAEFSSFCGDLAAGIVPPQGREVWVRATWRLRFAEGLDPSSWTQAAFSSLLPGSWKSPEDPIGGGGAVQDVLSHQKPVYTMNPGSWRDQASK